jgi:DNA-directed RNA polymerase specialized sigma24 family protein
MESSVNTRWTPLVEALARLDADSREIILLADVIGLSRADIAARLGLLPRGVMRRLAIARENFQFPAGCKQTKP